MVADAHESADGPMWKMLRRKEKIVGRAVDGLEEGGGAGTAWNLLSCFWMQAHEQIEAHSLTLLLLKGILSTGGNTLRKLCLWKLHHLQLCNAATPIEEGHWLRTPLGSVHEFMTISTPPSR